MANRFFTILIVPEKTSRIKKIIIPTWLVRGGSVALAFLILLAIVMIFDYGYVMSQIGENRQLKLENRRLRQQVQVFQNKMTTIENTMDRMKSFASRLKVIMHSEDRPPIINNVPLPDANSSIPSTEKDLQSQNNPHSMTPPEVTLDPEKLELQKEYSLLDHKISSLTREALSTEELLQDEYEILYDKRSFLSALPTRQPAAGYFTSGFGIRTSPYGDRVKMHEGVDIANRLGTPVRAPADGKVTFASSKSGYGLTLIVNHGYGIETWYGHLKKFLVTPGDKIKRGDKIALLGNSGRSTGPHVHYEIRVHGYPVDPLSYIFEDSSP